MRHSVYTNRLPDCIPAKCIYIITSLKNFSNNNVFSPDQNFFYFLFKFNKTG